MPPRFHGTATQNLNRNLGNQQRQARQQGPQQQHQQGQANQQEQQDNNSLVPPTPANLTPPRPLAGSLPSTSPPPPLSRRTTPDSEGTDAGIQVPSASPFAQSEKSTQGPAGPSSPTPMASELPTATEQDVQRLSQAIRRARSPRAIEAALVPPTASQVQQMAAAAVKQDLHAEVLPIPTTIEACHPGAPTALGYPATQPGLLNLMAPAAAEEAQAHPPAQAAASPRPQASGGTAPQVRSPGVQRSGSSMTGRALHGAVTVLSALSQASSDAAAEYDERLSHPPPGPARQLSSKTGEGSGTSLGRRGSTRSGVPGVVTPIGQLASRQQSGRVKAEQQQGSSQVRAHSGAPPAPPVTDVVPNLSDTTSRAAQAVQDGVHAVQSAARQAAEQSTAGEPPSGGAESRAGGVVTRVVDTLENAAEAVTHRLGLDAEAGPSEAGSGGRGGHTEGLGHKVGAGLAGLAGQVQHKVEEMTGSLAAHAGIAELPIETPQVLGDKAAQPPAAAAPAGPADESAASGVQRSSGARSGGFLGALLRTISGTKTSA